ncbi:hypothetical protein L6164_029829 [Bauhinia variegata]|uniref:Uncharacterized protein n=1 Tax=Bauhinia variegata TaxID=167791 RepID=A0ACB9LAT3_BAUVA|nr:hypothetical protein L6164_029829 [Bauhinia variegata]
MDEIVYGCKLARQLESSLVNLVCQPDILSRTIDEIVKTFTAAKERLHVSPHQYQVSSFSPMLPHEAFKEQDAQTGANIFTQELMRSSFTQPMDPLMIQRQQVIRSNAPFEGSERSRGSEGEVQPGQGSSLRQRRSRKNEGQKKTEVIQANQFGNPEVPPEDGFAWRKYGQKEILGSKYPRSYYRCTHQKMYACPAKKQVQRVDHNPNFLTVTYRGSHVCHISSTAPSFVPPQLLMDISQDMTQTISPRLSLHSSSVQLSLHGVGGGGGIAPAGGDAREGPSTSATYGEADMADAMFNVSGSSSGNNMEYLLLPADESEPVGEKKSS